MSLEVATFISQLVATNPTAGDKKNQGDDHFRLIKTVLQNSFPNTDRAMRFPEVVGKTGTYAVLEADDNKTILCDSSGGVFNLTLPTPSFDGWMVRVIKTDGSVNPIYVVPPSGTINGFAKIRVNIPWMIHTFLWTGSTYIYLDAGVSRAGAIETYPGNAPPLGFGLANGQSLLRADHPELFVAWGTTHGAADGTHFNAPDLRDRFLVGAGLTYVLAATGGANTVQLSTATIPSHGHVMDNPTHTHTVLKPVGKDGQATGFVAAGGQIWFGNVGGTDNSGASAANQTTQSTGGDGFHENRPPYNAVNFIFRLC